MVDERIELITNHDQPCQPSLSLINHLSLNPPSHLPSLIYHLISPTISSKNRFDADGGVYHHSGETELFPIFISFSIYSSVFWEMRWDEIGDEMRWDEKWDEMGWDGWKRDEREMVNEMMVDRWNEMRWEIFGMIEK